MTKTKSERIEQGPAERLKGARIDAGYDTQTKLVQEFGLSQATYSMHENAKRAYDLTTAKRYADMLNVSVEYLLFGSTPIPVDHLEYREVLNPKGELCAGRWYSADSPQDDLKAAPNLRILADNRYPLNRQEAYIVLGDAGGPLMPSGSVVNVLRVEGALHLLPVGAVVVVKQFEERENMFELSLRMVKAVTSEKMILALPVRDADSDDRSAQDIEVPTDQKHPTVEIVGRVLSTTAFLA